MKYRDLRDFLPRFERSGELKRVPPRSIPAGDDGDLRPRAESRGGRLYCSSGRVATPCPCSRISSAPPQRVAQAMGQSSLAGLRELGRLLAYLKEPEAPKGLRDAWDKLPLLRQIMNMAPRNVSRAPCQEIVWEGNEVDLGRLPIQTCWPGDAAPLITWGLTVTRGPQKQRQNLGIYRQQVIARNKVIMRWLAHRGGALDYRDHTLAHPNAAVSRRSGLGADPATKLGAR